MKKQDKENITVLTVQVNKESQSVSHLPKITSQNIGRNRTEPVSSFQVQKAETSGKKAGP